MEKLENSTGSTVDNKSDKQEPSINTFHDLPLLERNDPIETVIYQSTSPLSSQYSFKDVDDPHAVGGRCGLYNLGNTCFLNSGIQCLANTSPLVKFFLERFRLNKDMQETLTGKLYHLLCRVWSGKYSVIHPQDFKNILGIYHSQFQDYRQHDTQEFLALLLGTLHEQLNVKSNPMDLFHNPMDLFQPTESAISCSNDKAAEDVLVSDTEQRMNNSFDGSFSENDQTWAFPKRDSHCSNEKTVGKSFENSTNRNGLVADSSGLEDTQENNTAKSFLDSHRDGEFLILNNENDHTAASCDNQTNELTKNMNQSEMSPSSDADTSIKNIQSDDAIRNKGLVLLENRDEGMLREVLSKESICENSNHSTMSVHSMDSENCAVISNLKLCPSSAMEEEKLDPDSVEESESLEQLTDGSSSIQEHIQEPFQQPSMPHITQNIVENPTKPNRNADRVLLNNMVSPSSMPSFGDLYEKESKTLNINVLATEYMQTLITLDSEKFAKPDNIDRNQENVNLLSESYPAESEKDYRAMGIKDTNIRADKKSRLSHLCASCCMEPHSEECCNVHSIKRMKYEGTEKNLQMQALSKLNKNKILLKKENVNLLSNVTAELDQDVDIENSDDEDDDDNDEEEINFENRVADEHGFIPYTDADVDAANLAWRDYTDQNDSIIVSTFQGQFRSTVVCSECGHVSVTYEPFMYLTLPLPHAMERQLCVIFVPSHLPPVRYLLNMHKNDNIHKVKHELQNVVGLQDCDIIMAEVLDCHISRILDDNILLRFINDSTRKIYGFVMLPPPSFSDDQNNTADVASNTKLPKDNEFSGTNFISNAVSDESDIFNNMGTFTVDALSNVPDNKTAYRLADKLLDADSTINDFDMKHLFEPSSHDNVDSGVMGLDMETYNLQPERGDSDCLEQMGFPKQAYPETAGTGLWEWCNMDDKKEDVELAFPQWGGGDAAVEGSEEAGVTESLPSVVEQWKSCAICLEELPDTELLVHTTCSGTFCPSCLEMSFKHYGDTDFSCPVCSTPASMTEDFIPVAGANGHKPKTRVLAVPIAYRCEIVEDGWKATKLFGSPNIWYLPSNLNGQQLYEYVDRKVPFLTTYIIVLTDGQGMRCSRCIYTEHCSGCKISKQEDITLRPGDHLTIVVSDFTKDQIEAAEKLQDHKSMEKLRPDEPITIYDCFRSFTESEVLDEHNPWYCPQCQKNQRAKKTMTVWQYPDTLIIHLKRFVFYDMTSAKIDNKVVYPMDSLDLGDFISGPRNKDLRYNLYSIVNHFGGSNAGHYTSYAKHPLDREWYYFNDETVSHQAPRDEEYCSAYVLFYQRQDTDVMFKIPENFPFEEEENNEGTSHTTFAASVDLPNNGKSSHISETCSGPTIELGPPILFPEKLGEPMEEDDGKVMPNLGFYS